MHHTSPQKIWIFIVYLDLFLIYDFFLYLSNSCTDENKETESKTKATKAYYYHNKGHYYHNTQ